RDAYTVRFRAHGETHQGVLWKSAAAQTLRFERLLDILSDHPMGRPMTINDLGCGWGALFEHIARAPHLPPLAAYRGYDICPDMVMAARKRIRDPRARFTVASGVQADADYGIASGTFNLSMGVAPDAWDIHVRQDLRDLWRRSRRGLAFNLLDLGRLDGADPGTLHYVDPDAYLAFCRRYMSADVTVAVDDPIPDVTFLVRR
ncbi:MAG: class I SAM-dependent methyltransferase, partial [Rhodobacterales bacterium]|nr:class I SAM-dependent methyltransferase [Rhodobacterales bacterium]